MYYGDVIRELDDRDVHLVHDLPIKKTMAIKRVYIYTCIYIHTYIYTYIYIHIYMEVGQNQLYCQFQWDEQPFTSLTRYDLGFTARYQGSSHVSPRCILWYR